MKKIKNLLVLVFFITVISCKESKQPNAQNLDLKAGYKLSTENGWKIPQKAKVLNNDQVLNLDENIDEVELNMNDFLLYAQKKLSADRKIVLWAKSNIADVQPDGVVYLSITDDNLKSIETIEVINTNESEGGMYFDIFEFETSNKFIKSRMYKGQDGTDVLFRYEYQIKDNAVIELIGEFVNRSLVEEINAEKTKHMKTIYEYGLSFLLLGNSFQKYYLPEQLQVVEVIPNYSYELTENGKTIISYILINNFVEDIYVYCDTYSTENNIHVNSTFSELKNKYDIDMIECRADNGVWVKLKDKKQLEFQIDLPKNISCDNNDEISISSVPGNTKITCIRVFLRA